VQLIAGANPAWLVTVPFPVPCVVTVSVNVGGGAAVTVNGEVPLMPLCDAVIVTGPPAVTPLARPVALIVAIPVLLELHVAVLVKF
jgi:hypothetical protein